jgi:ribosomal protein S27E
MVSAMYKVKCVECGVIEEREFGRPEFARCRKCSAVMLEVDEDGEFKFRKDPRYRVSQKEI